MSRCREVLTPDIRSKLLRVGLTGNCSLLGMLNVHPRFSLVRVFHAVYLLPEAPGTLECCYLCIREPKRPVGELSKGEEVVQVLAASKT